MGPGYNRAIPAFGRLARAAFLCACAVSDEDRRG
jgi:hypothetical protein